LNGTPGLAYRTDDGQSLTVTAIVGAVSSQVIERDTGRILLLTRRITLRTSEVPNAGRGDQITVDGEIFTLDTLEIRQAGRVTFDAVRPVPIELAGEHYRNRV
jgi:hypothetical protein